MTWGRFDDGFTDRPVFEAMPYDVRWHYVALIMWCCRTGRYDGVIRAADARRCSDLDDPPAALATLVGAGLLVEADGGYRLVQIDEHALPEHLRDENRKPAQRERKRRSRARGGHASVTRDVTRDTGSGRDGPGRGEPPAHERAHTSASDAPDDEHAEPATPEPVPAVPAPEAVEPDGQGAEQPSPVDVAAEPDPAPEPSPVPRCACGERLLLVQPGRTQCERCRLADRHGSAPSAPVASVSTLPERPAEPERCGHRGEHDARGLCGRCAARSGGWRTA